MITSFRYLQIHFISNGNNNQILNGYPFNVAAIAIAVK